MLKLICFSKSNYCFILTAILFGCQPESVFLEVKKQITDSDSVAKYATEKGDAPYGDCINDTCKVKESDSIDGIKCVNSEACINKPTPILNPTLIPPIISDSSSIPEVPIPEVPVPITPVPEVPIPEVPIPEVPVPITPVPVTPVPVTPVPVTPVPVTPAPEVPIPEVPVPVTPVPVTPVPVIIIKGPSIIVEKWQDLAKADILWLIDDSGSMDWTQTQLTKNFSMFAQKIKNARLNYQLGVSDLNVCGTSADAYCPDNYYISGSKLKGSLKSYNSKKYLINNSNIETQFTALAKLGINGSAIEHGLTAAKFAIEKSFIDTNKGFIRQDSFLSIIIVSDEEDDGIGMWCEDAYGTRAKNKITDAACIKNSIFKDSFGNPSFPLLSTYNTKFDFSKSKMTADMFVKFANEKLGKGKYQVNAVTGIRKNDGTINCSNYSGNNKPLEAGTNYIKAAELTGGLSHNICTDDWGGLLDKIGSSVVKLSTKVELDKTKAIYEGSLVVKVDDMPYPNSNWSYDKINHAILFSVIPEAGSHIEVIYNVAIKK